MLDTLKVLFKNKIDSPRRFELITTITQLINVLEIRDVLSEENVVVLKDIARQLPNRVELLSKINLYEEYCSGLKDNIENCGVLEQNTTCSTKPITLHSTTSIRKLNRIKDTIINEIGSFWRDLARNLCIRECDIVDIEFLGNTTAERAELILDKYSEISDPEKWFVDLCLALEKARRKDLARSIQKIMIMKI